MVVRPDAEIDGVGRSHLRLIETAAAIDDAIAARPSLLPGWDVAMVLTHLARNADGHAFVAEGARRGEARQRYPDRRARDAGILAGRGRRAAELLEDLRSSARRLEEVWASLPPEAWAVTARSATGEAEPMAELPRYRWRETEVHHRDLGLAFDATDWDPAFVATELGIWMPGLADRLPDGTALEVTATDTGQTWTAGDGSAGFTSVEAPAAGLLAWLTGRGDDTLPRLSAWSW